MISKNLWILTEERPKNKVLQMIFAYFAKDKKRGFFADKIRIIPLLDEKHYFNFVYEVIGFKCAKVDKIFVKIVSGYSSFVDFLVFYQNSMPKQNDTPFMLLKKQRLMIKKVEIQEFINDVLSLSLPHISIPTLN